MVESGPQSSSAGGDGFGQERFLDRRQALVDLSNFFGVNVHADHLEPARGQRGCDAGTELALSAHGNFLNGLHEIRLLSITTDPVASRKTPGPVLLRRLLGTRRNASLPLSLTGHPGDKISLAAGDRLAPFYCGN